MQLQTNGLERSMIAETPAKFRFINRPYRFLLIFLRYISVHVIRIGSEIYIYIYIHIINNHRSSGFGSNH